MTSTLQDSANRPRQAITWAGAAFLTAIIVATYWSAIMVLVDRWYTDPNYIHGFLVAPLAGFLLWYRREMLQAVSIGSASRELTGSLCGIVLMALAGAMRMVSSYYYYDLLDPASLVPCLAGLALFVGGWNALRWAWPSIVFLVFMVPLPGFLASFMGLPLQRVATEASTYVIQTIGISAVAEGNVIYLSDSQLGVYDVCNGLHNMMLFLAVCVFAVFVLRRTIVEKVIIVLSSAPIAILANVVRIVTTAILNKTFGHQAGSTFHHDLAGAFMMPLAVIFLWLELAYLNRVFVRDTSLEEAA